MVNVHTVNLCRTNPSLPQYGFVIGSFLQINSPRVLRNKFMPRQMRIFNLASFGKIDYRSFHPPRQRRRCGSGRLGRPMTALQPPPLLCELPHPPHPPLTISHRPSSSPLSGMRHLPPLRFPLSALRFPLPLSAFRSLSKNHVLCTTSGPPRPAKISIPDSGVRRSRTRHWTLRCRCRLRQRLEAFFKNSISPLCHL